MVNWIIYLLLLVWPFGQLLTLNLGSKPIYPLDIIVFSIFVLNIRHILTETKKYPWYRFFTLYLTVSLIIFQILSPDTRSVLPWLYLARLVIFPTLYFIKIPNSKRFKELVKISVFIFLLIAMVQYVLSPDTSFMKYLGFDDHYYRLVGSFFDPNFTGAILSSLAVAIIEINPLLSLGITFMLGLTFSRASYLGYAVGLAASSILRKKANYLWYIFLIPIAYFVAPKPFGEGVNLSRTFSIVSRAENITSAFQIFTKNPIFGVGYNTLSLANIRVDNSYVMLLATSGVLGFYLFAKFILEFLKEINYLKLIPLIPIFVHSLFNNTLLYIWIYSYVFIFLRYQKIKD